MREAFRVGLISDGTTWMAMIQDRNLTNICEGYLELECFRQLRATLQQRPI